MIVKYLIYSLAVLVAAYIVPGVAINSYFTAFVFALILGLLNTFIRPVLLVLTLPLNILSLGLFTLVINLIILYLAASIVPGITIASLLSAIIFGLLLSLVNSFLSSGRK